MGKVPASRIPRACRGDYPVIVRRLAALAAALPLLATPALPAAEEAHEGKHARTPEAILADLKAGNARFVAGKATRPHATAKRLRETAKGQAPEAIILGCSDSRVPPEIVFDEGIGDLFIVRVAGNVAEEHTVGSVEYAAEHLNAPLVVVLGHHNCGAVKATAEATGPVEGNIGALVKEIQPAVEETKKGPAREGLVNDASHANARKQAEALVSKSPVLKHLVEAGKLKVVAAVYDLESGKIEWER
jgi:carbonic anhydrase